MNPAPATRNPKPMHIGIDARMYGIEHAGIGRYVMNLVQQLINRPSPFHFTLFLTNKPFNHLATPPNVTKVLTDIRHYSLAEQTQFLKLLNSHPVDLMHFPHFNVPLLYAKPFVVTVHDILWHHVKGLSVTTLNPLAYLLKYLGYRAVVRHAVTQSRKIITPSLWVKQQLLAQYSHLNENKIAITYEAADAIFTNLKSKRTSSLVSLPENYVLYTGSAYPHKNVRQLIEAIKILNQQHDPIKLVIVSSRSVFLNQLQNFVKRLHLQSSVIFTGQLTDEQLVSVYRQAKLLIHPSRSEGFGLTGLEAMAVGTPVLASNAGSLPEIYGKAAAYFNPDSLTDLATKLQSLIHDDQTLNQLRLSGFTQVKKYSWQKTADHTLEIYFRLCQKLNHPHYQA